MKRYDELRIASMYHIRLFGAVARLDLKALPSRRRSRRRGWQFYRPMAPKMQAIDIDVEELIREASGPG
jgi:hypothetical protein